MALVGSPAYFRVQGTGGVLALRGVLVEDQEDFLVIAVPGKAAVPGVDIEADVAAAVGHILCHSCQRQHTAFECETCHNRYCRGCESSCWDCRAQLCLSCINWHFCRAPRRPRPWEGSAGARRGDAAAGSRDT